MTKLDLRMENGSVCVFQVMLTSRLETRCPLDGVQSPFLDTEERTCSLQAGVASEFRQEVEHGALSWTCSTAGRTGSGISVHQQASAHHLNLERNIRREKIMKVSSRSQVTPVNLRKTSGSH